MTKRTIELDRHRDTRAQRETRIRRLLAEIKADEGVLHDRKQQLESRLADTPAFNSHNVTAKARYGLTLVAATQAAQAPPRQELTAAALDDLWRFSCEMPDAPHLNKN